MRCNNCGWDNKDDAAFCIKCDTALEKFETRPPAGGGSKTYEKTVFESIGGIPPNSSEVQTQKVYARTVTDVPRDDTSGNSGEDELVTCKSCGYLNPGDARVCAKCNLPLGVPAQATSPVGADLRNMMDSLSGPVPETKSGFKTTVDPYRNVAVKKNNCRLQLVAREGEINQHTVGVFPDNMKQFAALNSPIALNRTNLEDQNLTITSKIQAELFFEDGKWYLLDKSELETTFVRARNKIELREGDLILMGDRKFLFSAD